ncbi:MAG TPA: ABC transporter permease [Actinocrinis sp.]
MSGLGRVVRAGVARRRTAAVITCLSTLAATAAAVAATALLIASDQPFEHAFAAQNGAELTATFDGTRAGAARLADTAHANGVTSTAGPFPVATTTAVVQPDGVDATLPGLSVVGRADAGGPVDDVTLVSGHWVTGPGQIVLSTDIVAVPLGSTVRFPDAPGTPALTVVGYAQSITKSADAWVEPSRAFALGDAGTPPVYQMLYRFAQARTDGQMLADQAAVIGLLPKGTLVGTSSYLGAKQTAQHNIAPFVPFIVAFGILALATGILIITNVISGAVGAALFKIGVLKALGAAPAQVVRAYCLIALLPSVVGVVLGAVLGNVIANPELHNAEVAYGTGTLSVPVWTDIAIPAAVLALVAVCTVIPALRAGRMSATAALAVGRAPRPGRARFARRLLAGLPVPQSVGLGLGTPPTRPARYLSITAALIFGTMALTFAFGLGSSLSDVDRGLHYWESAQVTVASGQFSAGGKDGGEISADDDASIEAAIARQSGTAGYYGLARDEVSVLGSADALNASFYTAAGTSPYQIIAGRWYSGPDQVLVPTGFLDSTGTRIGDSVTLVDGNGDRVSVRIVGEVLDTLSDDGMDVVGDAATLPGETPDEFDVTLEPGVDVTSYLQSLNNAVSGYGVSAYADQPPGYDQTILAVDALAAALTLLVVVTAGLGVFNTVMLELRDRIRELGIYKALGMTPKQTMAMVLTSTLAVGVIAGAIGVPAGIALHDYVIPVMGHAAGTGIPRADVAVYHGLEEVLLALGGTAIAVLAALVPAGWAARLRTATALRTE